MGDIKCGKIADITNRLKPINKLIVKIFRDVLAILPENTFRVSAGWYKMKIKAVTGSIKLKMSQKDLMALLDNLQIM